MSDRKTPKSVPSLSLKLTTLSTPTISGSSNGTVPWTGNVGTKKFFLGIKDNETISDEDLYQMFLQKEPEFAEARNAATPFQYTKANSTTTRNMSNQSLSPPESNRTVEKSESESIVKEGLQRVKDDVRDASYEAWAAQMTSMVQLRKEEQRTKQGPSEK